MAPQPGRKVKPSRRAPTSPPTDTNRKWAFRFRFGRNGCVPRRPHNRLRPIYEDRLDAYMSQVKGFWGGERDYSNLKGDTGPLVYPAGFLYVYFGIQYLTGGEVYPAQILFGVLYVVNLCVVLFIYLKTDKLPWWGLILLCLSKRVHSIFVLRLFNDCIAMTLLHIALASFLCQKWHLGMIIFSGAVSVKMNVLLYAPPLFLLLLKAMPITRVVSAITAAALVQ